MTSIQVAALLALATLSGLADAAAAFSTNRATLLKTATQGRSAQLARADRDGNGLLSHDEVRQGAPRLAASFDAIDANHDGQLSPQEIRAWSRSHAAQRGRDGAGAVAAHFARADRDGNGLLSRDEAAVHLPRIAAKFDRIDANHDGMITSQELGDYLKGRRAGRSRAQGAAPSPASR